MKLGVSYSVFNGIELLEDSIKQIRNYVDYICVVFQKVDWYGKNNLKDSDLQILINLKNKGLINKLVCYELKGLARNSIEAKKLETEKRNIGRNYCIKNNCTHYLDLDVDEFFIPDEFQEAKKFIEYNEIDYTFCNIVEYYKIPIFRKKKISNIMIPFICKLDIEKKLGTNNVGLKIDPTRGYILDDKDVSYIFQQEQIKMHHMTGIRTDLLNKFQSTSQSVINRSNLNEIVNDINKISDDNLVFSTKGFNFNGIVEYNDLEEVEDIFNIRLNKIKLGVGYSVFNGCELLEHSIKQIRKYVDYIVVSYQEKNYYGETAILDRDYKILFDLKNKGMIDELYCFKIDEYAEKNNGDEAQKIESRKRQENRIRCLKAGMTHFLDIDCDEFYITEQFIKAKKFIETHNINYSVVEYVNYYKNPTIQLTRNENNPRYCPFICKIKEDEDLTFGDKFCSFRINDRLISVDKSRWYNTRDKIYLFDSDKIMMHHMTGVRINISDKYQNYSGRSEDISKNIDFLTNTINQFTGEGKINSKFNTLLYLPVNSRMKTIENIFNIPMGMFK